MAIRVALRHVTHYSYDRPVDLGAHVVRLRPAPHSRTRVEAYSLKITPDEHFLNWQQDPFGNWQARVVFPKPRSRELKVEIDLIADLSAINPFDFFIEEYAEQVPFEYEKDLLRELRPYLEVSASGPRLLKFVSHARDAIMRPGRRCVDVLVEVNQLVQTTLRYDIRMEPGVFEPEETLTRGHGSCRDFAWLLVNVFRHLGFASRFVSGYSIQLKADQKPESGPAGVEEDCTDLHAWAEVYLPGAGFIGFDATSGLACGEGHIPLACTADPGSAAPISGSYGFSKAAEGDEPKETFAVQMSITRLEDRPRPTKPYSEAQWQALLACGDAVERALVKGDVRLTMGGEPTFVAIDDPEGDEWNTTAVGPTKHVYADKLVRRLLPRFAPGGFLHHGLGKWYPGETLPRWAHSCYFRKDGEPIWQEPALFADSSTPKVHDASRAQTFVTALCKHLGVSAQHAVAGYEDVFYYLWRERRLPVNVDPFESKLDDPQERARLLSVFEGGLTRVVGYALPLRAETNAKGATRWHSAAWVLREGRMYLLPGDSPMGYRLPLDALPWSKPEDRIEPTQRDPMDERAQLPPREALLPNATRVGTHSPLHFHEAPRTAKAPAPVVGQSANDVVRTALCVEPRDGILRVFMPPLDELEQYLVLLAAIEASAAELAQPIMLEGYHPPGDHRLSRLQVTPDPGVIEVNIHPASSWQEIVASTTVLYDEAKACRLATDKFMIDGRHSGTGGGNHITLGGPTPADSPFLRRPDLVRSFTSYWLNHPALSYLFSGLFVGPTSQAPRVDEARNDSLYELEIAYDVLKQQKGETPPWLVDRVFRHLLTDVTGNTHRTELCIDKLYSPDSSSGRQGLIELRAFEMPPDARMSCAAQLLVRGLLAWFWQKPYEEKLVRWGTSLLDRFMLPHFVAQDMRDIVRDLQGAGFAFDEHWFDPQYEFRFPFVGRVTVDGTTIELRQAVEPWHVLGEQPAAGGTVRYVDSSVERMQVIVRNMVSPRHVLTCNGQRVPLHATGTAGEYVAGVRYRAWQPPTAFHPTIGVHAPLTFDLLDSWSERSLGGCTYHVAHPGGLAHEVFPRNALEAETRRIARFFAFGHSQGKQVPPPVEHSDELPLTLDLRRHHT